MGIEVKLARTVDDNDVKHLLWLKDRLGAQLRDVVVIHTGPGAYRRPDGVAVTGALQSPDLEIYWAILELVWYHNQVFQYAGRWGGKLPWPKAWRYVMSHRIRLNTKEVL